MYAVVLRLDNWDGMLQISPQHTTEDTLNTLLDKAETICLLKKLLNMLLHNLCVNSYNNEERIVMEFSGLFAFGLVFFGKTSIMETG